MGVLTIPNTLTNGTPFDATEVAANFNAVAAYINAPGAGGIEASNLTAKYFRFTMQARHTNPGDGATVDIWKTMIPAAMAGGKVESIGLWTAAIGGGTLTAKFYYWDPVGSAWVAVGAGCSVTTTTPGAAVTVNHTLASGQRVKVEISGTYAGCTSFIEVVLYCRGTLANA